MPNTTADTPDTFSGTGLFIVTKTTRCAARLLLWQRKQWLNIGTDWNNPSVCPLVHQTSCLTKLNPRWCRAFRPVSLHFCLPLFFPSVLSFCLSGSVQVHSSGHWSGLFFFSACSQQKYAQRRRRREEGQKMEMEKRKRRTQKRERKFRLKVKQAWKKS